ncbi:MAG: rRNA pseudouridine synthase [Candidatus Andersenbacteria bacterium]|nr:rRNA pseudouridine synthase [Candidatus Andersenbacteria bacterium]
MIVQKYLVQQGICSRREAEALLKAGHIYVNGKPARPGVPLEPTDVVTIDSAGQTKLDTKMTVAIYKPRGVMCTTSEKEGMNVFQVFPEYNNLHLVGRLDKESEGLLLLSNDGLITKQVTGDLHTTEKEYEVTVLEKVFAGKLKPMQDGMKLADRPTLPAQVWVLDNHTFRIILREGRNRQIRRMCGALNLTVETLKRIRIGQIELDEMEPGQSRKLTAEEIQTLKKV